MLLFCITTLNGARRINEKTLRRMIEHMTKIKNLLRNLADSSTPGSTPDSSTPGSTPDSSTPSSTSTSTSPTSSSTAPNSTAPGSTSPSSTSFSSIIKSTTPSTILTISTTIPTTIPTTILTTTIPITTIPTNSNSTDAPLTANPNFKRRNRDFRINILAFNCFKPRITFAVFFLFREKPIYKTIIFILTIRYIRRIGGFRYLQGDVNQTATCNADSEITEGKNARYTCESSINGNPDNIEQVAIADINIPGLSSSTLLEDINFSDEALLAASNLQNFTNEVDKMYDLKNGELIHSNKYFIIKGDIDDYNGEVGDDFKLQVYDNSDGNDRLKNASCSVQTITNKKYQFKCTSEEDISGYIHLASMYGNNKNAINLYMNEGNETLSFKGSDNSGNTRSNPIYKKSSSGLSGGAIAGIVIACAVVLIIASIIAMMLRKPSVPIKNNSSITELRSIDNYTQ